MYGSHVIGSHGHFVCHAGGVCRDGGHSGFAGRPDGIPYRDNDAEAEGCVRSGVPGDQREQAVFHESTDEHQILRAVQQTGPAGTLRHCLRQCIPENHALRRAGIHRHGAAYRLAYRALFQCSGPVPVQPVPSDRLPADGRERQSQKSDHWHPVSQY